MFFAGLSESFNVIDWQRIDQANRYEAIRKYAGSEGKALKDAVEQAVTECIKEGILAKFLEANRREVVAVSIFEYDEEKALELLR